MTDSDSPDPDRTRADDTLPDESDNEGPTHEGRHPAVIATVIALPVALLVGVVVAAVLVGRNPATGTVGLGPVPAPEAQSQSCTDLLEVLPDRMDDFSRADLADPAPPGAAAWQDPDAAEVVLRCGLERPDEFDQAAALQIVDGVQWFEVSGADQGIEASTWFVVDRPVYVALTVPDGSGPTPVQDISAAIAEALPRQDIDPAPITGN